MPCTQLLQVREGPGWRLAATRATKLAAALVNLGRWLLYQGAAEGSRGLVATYQALLDAAPPWLDVLALRLCILCAVAEQLRICPEVFSALQVLQVTPHDKDRVFQRNSWITFPWHSVQVQHSK